MVRSMDALRDEVHALFLRPFVHEADEALGAARVDALLSSLDAPPETLREDDNAWVSLRFCERFFEQLDRQLGDPMLFQRCGRISMSRRYLGFARAILRASNSPRFAYRSVVKYAALVNKVGEVSLRDLQRDSATLVYKSIAGAPRESSDYVCRARAAQYAAVAGVFDIAPAEVTHEECMHRGANACVYELRWTSRSDRWLRWVLAAVFGGAAAAGLVFLSAPIVAIAAFTVFGIIGGFGVGRAWELRKLLDVRVNELSDITDALDRSAAEHVDRFRELTEAKREVEAKVEQRTEELSRTSAQLERTVDEVRALEQSKSEFFTNVSHELRTPLTLLLTPLQDLARGQEPPGGAKNALITMERNAQRLLTLMNQMLDLAKAEAGAARLELVAVSPRALLDEVMVPFSTEVERAEITLSTECGVERSIGIDASWIETALTNLVSNAIKFTGKGGHVVLGLVEEDESLVFTVRDDGEGMSQAEADNVFERFAQTSGTQAGTGVGLALVREAARLHGGTVSVESARGVGTTFELRVPLLDLGEADTSPAESRSHLVPVSTGSPYDVFAGAESRSEPREDAPLVLVVEDNDDLRELVHNVLRDVYRVLLARDGAEALALARERQPDVIVSDVSMPRMTGLELCRAVREDERLRDRAFLLLTSRGKLSETLEGYEAGADDYVTKPFHGRELLARIDVQLRLRETLRRIAHQERLATLGVLATSVAHQIRNPLTSLMSGLPAVQGRLAPAMDAPTKEMFSVMYDCAERIEEMTHDLMDLARVDREDDGKFEPGRGVRASLRLLSTRFPGSVHVEHEIDLNATCHGRAGDLNHVFLNVIDNAARSVGNAGSISIKASTSEGDYIVTVEDSGPGVPQGLRDRIFEPFVTTRGRGEGTGLGLAIAKNIVDQHRGRIEVATSERLGGALFRIRIPLAT